MADAAIRLERRGGVVRCERNGLTRVKLCLMGVASFQEGVSQILLHTWKRRVKCRGMSENVDRLIEEIGRAHV